MIALPENAIAPHRGQRQPGTDGVAVDRSSGRGGQTIPRRSAPGAQGALDVVVVSVQPPPSTLYSVTWFCACARRAASASCLRR